MFKQPAASSRQQEVAYPLRVAAVAAVVAFLNTRPFCSIMLPCRNSLRLPGPGPAVEGGLPALPLGGDGDCAVFLPMRTAAVVGGTTPIAFRRSLCMCVHTCSAKIQNIL